MTTGAMVLGAVPLALATGAGAESRQQIGWVIVGGMLAGHAADAVRRADGVHAARAPQGAGREQGRDDAADDASAACTDGELVARTLRAAPAAQARLDRAVEHHHVDLVARGDVALRVVQHDQAVGLHHRAEHARALVAGDAHLQRAVGAVLTMPRWYSVRPGFLRIGSWLRACSSGGGDCACSPSCAAGRGARRPGRSPSPRPGCRAGRTAPPAVRACRDAAHRHRAARPHGDAPEGHVAELASSWPWCGRPRRR